MIDKKENSMVNALITCTLQMGPTLQIQCSQLSFVYSSCRLTYIYKPLLF